MAENTKIEWCDHTFNHVRGCTKVSPGCANCYAETLSKRNPGTLGTWGPNGARVVASEAMWKEPLKWNKAAACCCRKTIADHEHESGCPQRDRLRVFCASLADVFEDWQGSMVNAQGETLFQCCQCQHTWAADMANYDPTKRDKRPICQECLSPGPNEMTMQDVRNRLFRLIDQTPNLDWLLLTKRPDNALRMMPKPAFDNDGWNGTLDGYWHQVNRPRHNVWLGTTVENQKAADERIPHLLKVPAAVRFLSCEPLLGPVDLRRYFYVGEEGGWEYAGSRSNLISWVIVGGESGHGARPCNVDWIRDIVRQCRDAGVPCFVKQLGAKPFGYWVDGAPKEMPTQAWRLRIKDKKGGDIDEFPADLRVREFPKASVAS